MFSRTRKKKSKKNHSQIIILITTLIVCLTFLCFLIKLIYNNMKIKKNFETDAISIYEKNSSDTFKIDKIFLYSSANAISKDTTRNLWNLDIYQFTDIAIYLKNNNDTFLDSESTIKELYIDNVNFGNSNEKGTPELYYKDIKNFGTSEIIEENKINDSLNFNIINSNDTLDTTSANFYSTYQTPITLEFVNNNIKENAIIPNDGTSLKFDGSLLQRANISLNSIISNVSFNINILNELDEKYVCKVNISIPLDNNENNLYNGFVKKELTDIPNSNFLKLKEND